METKTLFPIRIRYLGDDQDTIVWTPDGIKIGSEYKVLETNIPRYRLWNLGDRVLCL